MIYLIIGLITALIFAYIKFAVNFNGLPVLMYHKVSDQDNADFLTVTTKQLERQFQYFNKKKYSTILLSDLLAAISRGEPLPPKPLLLTFDDGFKNNYTNLYPLLRKYGLKANIFLVAGFIGHNSSEGRNNGEFLHIDDIHQFSEDTVQFGLHTFDHKSYADLSISQIDEDIKRSQAHLDQLSIHYQPCLAYTYGAYPKKDLQKRIAMFDTLTSNNIELAMRIGNRINKLPIKNKMLIERIDIRGNESFLKFKISLAAGRKIFFK